MAFNFKGHPYIFRMACVSKTLSWNDISDYHMVLKHLASHADIFATSSLSQILQTSSWWRHQMEIFPFYWPIVKGIYWSPVDSLQKASDAELWCFLWSAPDQMDDQTIAMPVILDTVALIMTSLWYDITLHGSFHGHLKQLELMVIMIAWNVNA